MRFDVAWNEPEVVLLHYHKPLPPSGLWVLLSRVPDQRPAFFLISLGFRGRFSNSLSPLLRWMGSYEDLLRAQFSALLPPA